MKVKELLADLKEYPKSMEVKICFHAKSGETKNCDTDMQSIGIWGRNVVIDVYEK